MKKLFAVILALAALPAFALFTDVDNAEYWGKTGIKKLTEALDANFAQIEAGTWTIDAGPTATLTGEEAGNSTLILDADQGDDNPDTWTIRSTAATNALDILNHTTVAASMDTAGVLTTIGGVTITDADGAAVVTATGYEANNASLVLDADQGDDNADTWTVTSAAADNDLDLINHTSTVVSFTSTGAIKSAYGVGAVAGTGATVVEYGNGVVHQTVITFTDTPVVLADEAGVIAYGGLKVYDLPEGAILLHGAVTDIALTKSSAGVNADWDGDMAVGTATAANDADLTSTEADIIPKTATPQAAAGATTADALTTTALLAIFDGTATAKDVFINFLVDDADHDVTSTPCNLVLNGTLTITWIKLGDK